MEDSAVEGIHRRLDIEMVFHVLCGKDYIVTIQNFVTFHLSNNMRHSTSTMRVSALLHQTPRQLVRTRNPRISEQSLRMIVYNIEQPAVTKTIFLVLQYPPPRIPRLLIRELALQRPLHQRGDKRRRG